MSFEKLKVYQAAERLDEEVLRLCDGVPEGHGKEVDNLKRASGSVPHNIAEAYGLETPGNKVHHLKIARGSTDEARSALRRLIRRRALTAAQIYKGTVLARTVAKMLTSLIEAIEEDEAS